MAHAAGQAPFPLPSFIDLLLGVFVSEGEKNPEGLSEILSQSGQEPPKEGEPLIRKFEEAIQGIGGGPENLDEPLGGLGINLGTPTRQGPLEEPGGVPGLLTTAQKFRQGQEAQLDPLLQKLQGIPPVEEIQPPAAPLPPLPPGGGRGGAVGTPGVGGGFAPEDVLPQAAAAAGGGGDILQALAALRSITPAPPLPPPGTTGARNVQNIITPGLLAQLLQQQDPRQQATLGQLIQGGI